MKGMGLMVQLSTVLYDYDEGELLLLECIDIAIIRITM